MKRGGTFKDRTGQKYGRLTAIEVASSNGKGVIYWKCVCSCGKEVSVSSGHLGSGHTLSCGCYLADKNRARCTTHGESPRKNHTKEYNTWASMRSRCKYKCNKHYHRYGGRGIKVCERWDKSFDAFLEDMGRCPEGATRMTIERLNNNLGYFKENCEWRSYTDQANNRHTNHLIEINGRTQTLMQWSREVGKNVGTILDRIRRGGWNPADAVMEPVRKGNYVRKSN